MSEKHDYSCRVFRCEDEEKVRQLTKNVFNIFLDGEFWIWKYKLNPSFNPSLVMVAERDGVIIGCNHWLLRNFKLSPTLETKAVLGADIAVRPEYRGKGVGTSLLRSLRSSEVLRNEKPSIVYIFANPSLAKHFHTPAGGYVPAPDRTVVYFKILNWKKFAENANKLNEQIAEGKFKDRLSKFELKVLFEISDVPPLYFCMSEKGVTVGEKEQNAEITITGDLATFQKIRTEKKRKWSMFKALFTMKLRVKGKPKKLVTFYKNFWMLQEILSRKIT
jgi:predicted N-acetyltransferase YhbS/putative sterol carrier protein